MGENYFSSSRPPVCRTIFVLHAGGDEDEDEDKDKGDVGGERRVTWRGGGGALLAWLRKSASLVVLRWRLVAERKREEEKSRLQRGERDR
jgi:hypothetical protein